MQKILLGYLASASLALSGCVTPNAESMGPYPSQSGWKVSVHVEVEANNCTGGRGTMNIAENTLSFFGQGMSYPDWQVALEPDGSAKKTVGVYIHPNRKVRVQVAAGTGPREGHSPFEFSGCGYKYIPD